MFKKDKAKYFILNRKIEEKHYYVAGKEEEFCKALEVTGK
jgi:hypothetical protein